MSKTRNTLLIIFSILLIPVTIVWLCNYLHNNLSQLEKLVYDDLQRVVEATFLPKPAGHEHFVRETTDFYSPSSHAIKRPFIYEKDEVVMVRLAKNSQDLAVIKQPVMHEKDHEVVVRLTEKNFSSFIAENKYVMVNFYALWCHWSRKLAPEYEAAAATLLKGDGVAFAEVDANTERGLAWKYEISGYPTVFLFVDGLPKTYDGKSTRDDIVRWLRNITASVPSIKKKDDAEHLLTDFNSQDWQVIMQPVIHEKDHEVVVVLTEKNFSSFIAEHEYVMVDFYAPWCYWSRKLAPEYEAAAATLLEGDAVALAKVDATTEGELARKYEISGYPTLLLFTGGIPKHYYGDRTRDAIVRYVRQSTAGFPSITDEYDAEHVLANGETGQFGSKKANFLFGDIPPHYYIEERAQVVSEYPREESFKTEVFDQDYSPEYN